jgi:hypothetical protein
MAPQAPAQPEEEGRLWKAVKMAAMVVGGQIVVKQLLKGVSPPLPLPAPLPQCCLADVTKVYTSTGATSYREDPGSPRGIGPKR